MEIFGWRLVWPVKVIYVRGRGFGWSYGRPIYRVRVLRYAHLAKPQDD